MADKEQLETTVTLKRGTISDVIGSLQMMQDVIGDVYIENTNNELVSEISVVFGKGGEPAAVKLS